MSPKKIVYPEFVGTLPNLEGKSVAITGTTSGTGFQAAKATIKKGATALFLINRDSERSKKILGDLEAYKEEVESKTELIKIDCDFSKIESVEEGAKQLNETCEKFGGLNVLANNAGIMGFPDERTGDGYDVQMQINHLGQYLLSRLVLPSLKRKHDAGEEVRLVQHSSAFRNNGKKHLEQKYFQKCKEKKLGGHGLKASFERYHQSKLSNSCFAMILAKKLEEREDINTKLFKSVVAEPGMSDTNLMSGLKKAHKGHGTMHNVKIATITGIFTAGVKATIKFNTEEDGSLCLLQAMFGENVENGDFFMPEGKTVGLPFKEFSKCKLVEHSKFKETYTLDEENQQNVWKFSEEEMGPFFENI